MAGLNPMFFGGAAAGIQGINSLSSGYSQSVAQETQGAYQRQQADTNARLSEISATDALDRGKLAARNIQRQGDQLVGEQRGADAASGVDANSGSALAYQSDTRAQTQQDVLRANNNAWREAWGYRVQANQYSGQGAFAQMAANNSARNSILTGGLQFVQGGMQAGYYLDGGGKK